MRKITSKTIVKRVENRVLVTELGEEILMMDIKNGKYLQLNKAGRLIWKKTEKPVEVVMLVNYLTNLFKIEKAACFKETVNFLHTMEEKNLFELVNN